MRVTRDASGAVIKRTFTVYDFNDAGNKWLTQWSRDRLSSYVSEGHEVNVVDSFTEVAHT